MSRWWCTTARILPYAWRTPLHELRHPEVLLYLWWFRLIDWRNNQDMEEQIQRMMQEGEMLEEKISLQKKQFHLFLYSLDLLCGPQTEDKSHKMDIEWMYDVWLHVLWWCISTLAMRLRVHLVAKMLWRQNCNSAEVSSLWISGKEKRSLLGKIKVTLLRMTAVHPQSRRKIELKEPFLRRQLTNWGMLVMIEGRSDDFTWVTFEDHRLFHQVRCGISHRRRESHRKSWLTMTDEVSWR